MRNNAAMADCDAPAASTLSIRPCDSGAAARNARFPLIYGEPEAPARAGTRGRGHEIDGRFVTRLQARDRKPPGPGCCASVPGLDR
jgi:hypothetical protein